MKLFLERGLVSSNKGYVKNILLTTPAMLSFKNYYPENNLIASLLSSKNYFVSDSESIYYFNIENGFEGYISGQYPDGKIFSSILLTNNGDSIFLSFNNFSINHLDCFFTKFIESY